MSLPYIYEYIDDVPRDFPTLGLREVMKGDRVHSKVQLNSPFLKEIITTTTKSIEAAKGSDE